MSLSKCFCIGIINIAAFALFSKVQVIEVEPTPQPENAQLVIVYPENGQMQTDSKVKMQIRVTNFTLGENSDFPRKNEIYNSKLGQNVHIIIDNEMYFPKEMEQTDPFNDEGIEYDTMIEFYLPKLSVGLHTLRAFICRSFNESLKYPGGMDAHYFYFQNKRPLIGVDLKSPYLTYNEPSPRIAYDAKKPILLDFLISNCELSADGYKVKLTIDNRIVRILNKYSAYYIYGLEKGLHSIQLQLINQRDRLVEGLFNDVKTTIEVK